MFLSEHSTTQAGDIAFYLGKPDSLIDTAISLRTGSPVVHVAVYEDEDHTIAATSNGITRQLHGGEHAIWRPSAPYITDRLVEALAFLRGEVGKPYGYADIANQLLLLTGNDPVLLDKSEDCSDLACKFLWVAGVALPYPLIQTNRVTPGGLYLALQHLP